MSGKRLSPKKQQEAILSSLTADRNDSLNQLMKGILVIGDDWHCLFANQAAASLCQSSMYVILTRPIVENILFNHKNDIYRKIVNWSKKSDSLLLENKFPSNEGVESV
jgi:hypothetical protein